MSKPSTHRHVLAFIAALLVAFNALSFFSENARENHRIRWQTSESMFERAMMTNDAKAKFAPPYFLLADFIRDKEVVYRTDLTPFVRARLIEISLVRGLEKEEFQDTLSEADFSMLNQTARRRQFVVNERRQTPFYIFHADDSRRDRRVYLYRYAGLPVFVPESIAAGLRGKA